MDIEIVTVVVGPFQQNCRIVKDRSTGEALIIDPGDEADHILEVARQHDAEVVKILCTHAHLDHAGAVEPLKRVLGVPFALHGADFPILEALGESGRRWGIPGIETPAVEENLEGVDSLPFAGGEIQVLHAPGHTPGGVIFLFGKEGMFGDTLFRLSVGRTDLGGNAQVYARTLQDVVLALDDDVVVHCGHGPSTTIGVERRENPFLNGQIAIDAAGAL